MMMALVNLGLIIFILLSEFIREKTRKFDYLTLFNIIFIICYPLPAFLLGFNLGTDELSIGHKLYAGDIKTTYAIFMGYFVVITGFYAKSASKAASNILITDINKNNKKNKVILLAVFLLLFSFISIHIYGLQYGGVMDALSKTMLIRSNVEESGSLVFFKHFMNFSYFASYLFAAYCFSKQLSIREYLTTKRLLLSFLLILSIFTSLFASFLSSSRAALIYYLTGFYLVYILKMKKLFSVHAVPIVLFIIFFILYGKSFLFSFTALPDGLDSAVSAFADSMHQEQADSDKISSFYQILANFCFPLYSLDTALNTDYDLRLFVDMVYAVTNLIPERVFNISKPLSISEDNTFLILGNADYQVPAGILAFGIYSFSWLGLIIVCFIYGWLGRYLQTCLERCMDEMYWIPFIYILTALQWVDFIPSGDPVLSLKAGLGYFVPMILLLSLCSKVDFQRRKVININS